MLTLVLFTTLSLFIVNSPCSDYFPVHYKLLHFHLLASPAYPDTFLHQNHKLDPSHHLTSDR